ncbi:Quinolinate phosphoribosyl transferase [Lobosporangium transversale]|uniref:Nicotinate phosphoribosyltransferase n=1 Tax=Lobosporangium transversale TaxID=64571 RepID=A0A1Y2H0R8_9FUNG|nr:Quinolinate phosphoribosyl transferase [Lobosporangium transversale]ORZ28150.1 Quinolinate phosphoribosyl transferase [Lobosporangium transversale]|eukprot:XP_021885835.1 Quinolinate phosphoribosyl transferase [Lobosporangium transversale]
MDSEHQKVKNNDDNSVANVATVADVSQKIPKISKACTSILDNDLYKFTMQQAVRQHYPNTPCDYSFNNRSPEVTQLSAKAIPWLQEKIQAMKDLSLTPEERVFLETKCPYLSKDYLDWLQHEFRFKPSEQVKIEYLDSVSGSDNQKIKITVTGNWHQVILYEVPLLALVSEAYFRFEDQDWSYEAERLIEAGAKFAEFGTRRRRDYETHRIVLEGIIAGSSSSLSSSSSSVASAGGEGKERQKGLLTGTSNLHFAHIMNLTPIGTMAHEWFMGTAAILKDASRANATSLERWSKTYPDQALGIALTDTFTTEAFLKTFRGQVAREWTGVRHDSGDPFEFIKRIVKHYDEDPLVGPELRRKKRIVFSDGLNVERTIRLLNAAEEQGIEASFGIGTHFTNDFERATAPKETTTMSVPTSTSKKEKSPAMNIVIKLHWCADKECVKLSDDHGKESGSPESVLEVRQQIATLS